MANAEFSLPFFREEAEAAGYELPKPFGISIGNISLQQGIVVDSITLSDVKLPDRLSLFQPLVKSLHMNTDQGMQKSHAPSIRADVWILPFFNLYGIVGMVDGYSSTKVDVSLKGSLGAIPIVKDQDFKLDLNGYTGGIGFVLAGGYGSWFALVDASYSKTKMTIIEGSIASIVASPRVGYDFKRYGFPLRAWVGAMYQNIEQSLSGNLARLGFAGIEGKFVVEQHLQTQWNTTAGFQYAVNQNWNVLSELGFGKRESLFVSLERRF